MKKISLVLCVMGIGLCSTFWNHSMNGNNKPVVYAEEVTATVSPNPQMEKGILRKTSADNRYEYLVLDDEKKQCSVITVNEVTEKIEIPQTIDGYTVVQIGETEKENTSSEPIVKTNVKKVKIIKLPNTVENIGAYACKGMKALKSINIKNIKVIEDGGFYQCEKLTSWTFEKAVFLHESSLGGIKIKKLCFKNELRGGTDFFSGTANEVRFEGKCVDEGLELNASKVKKLYIGKNIKSFDMYGTVRKIVVAGKNTTLKYSGYGDNNECILYTYDNAKALENAENFSKKIVLLKASNIGKISYLKKGKKIIAKWGKKKSLVITKELKDNGKWGNSKKSIEKYSIYENGKYLKSTSKNSIKVKKKNIKVCVDVEALG